MPDESEERHENHDVHQSTPSSARFQQGTQWHDRSERTADEHENDSKTDGSGIGVTRSSWVADGVHADVDDEMHQSDASNQLHHFSHQAESDPRSTSAATFIHSHSRRALSHDDTHTRSHPPPQVQHSHSSSLPTSRRSSLNQDVTTTPPAHRSYHPSLSHTQSSLHPSNNQLLMTAVMTLQVMVM